MNMNDAVVAAVRNVSRRGDTDIFPLPFENLIFADREADVTEILFTLHREFKKWLSSYPPETIQSLTQIGYTGFRWATLIDPFWNAYYLALVVSLADQIEAARIPEADEAVFSYRFNWQKDEARLFKDSTWTDFRSRCLKLADSCAIVV